MSHCLLPLLFSWMPSALHLILNSGLASPCEILWRHFWGKMPYYCLNKFLWFWAESKLVVIFWIRSLVYILFSSDYSAVCPTSHFVKCPRIFSSTCWCKTSKWKNFAEDFVCLLNDTSYFCVLFVNVFSLKVSCSFVECLPNLGTGSSAVWGVLTPYYSWHAFHSYIHTLTLTLVTVVVSSTVLCIPCVVPVTHFTTLHLTVLMLSYKKLPW